MSSASASPTPISTLLRGLTIATFPPALIILLAHLEKSHEPFPVLGLIPLAVSAAQGVLVLRRGAAAPAIALGLPLAALPPSSYSIFLLDVLVALGLVGMLIPSFVWLTDFWGSRVVILGSYGTMFMVVNLVIHAYFAVTYPAQILMARAYHCPNCHGTGREGDAVSTAPLRADYNDGDDLEAGPKSSIEGRTPILE